MDHTAPTADEVSRLAAMCAEGQIAVLTGAGISTASGIPDYRGPETARRARNPVQLREFMRSKAARARYWSRSLVGYPRIAGAQPNRSHHGLVALSSQGRLRGLITQNVDGLHGRAGHPEHVELHGALREVVCLSCGDISSRDALQAKLSALHPEWSSREAMPVADGDAELDDDELSAFPEVTCSLCRGVLKPHVVFFGENVPSARVQRAMACVDQARALLVLGSSLTVYSGLRFVRRAHEHGIPVAIVALGATRADGECTLKIDAGAGATLDALQRALGV